MKMVGTLEEMPLDEDQRKRIVLYEGDECSISIQVKDRYGTGKFYRPLAVEITLECLSLSLLDRFIKAGQHSYNFFEWKLAESLDLETLANDIYTQTGRCRCAGLDREGHITSLQYVINESSINIWLVSRPFSSPTSVCVTSTPRVGFFHAHELFSVRKILALLYGKLTQEQIQYLSNRTYADLITE